MKLKRFLLEETEKNFDVRNIEKETIGNDYFRKVLYTGDNIQLVLMSLEPNSEIGEEVHDDTDQFFRIEEGEGKAILDGTEHNLKDGSTVTIRQGTKHNIKNTSNTKMLRMYTLYAPPHHPDGTVHKTKEEAEEDEMMGEGLLCALNKKEDYVDSKIEKAGGRRRLMLRKQKTQIKKRKKELEDQE